MLNTLSRLFRKWSRRPVKGIDSTVKIDSADFIIERYQSKGRVSYRVRHWLPEAQRYTFEGEFYWIAEVWRKLECMGVPVDEVAYVPVVDLDEDWGKGK